MTPRYFSLTFAWVYLNNSYILHIHTFANHLNYLNQNSKHYKEVTSIVFYLKVYDFKLGNYPPQKSTKDICIKNIKHVASRAPCLHAPSALSEWKRLLRRLVKHILEKPTETSRTIVWLFSFLVQGKKTIGATCSTNYAAEYNFNSRSLAHGKWRYVCTCKGTSTLFTRGGPKNCYLHYWECPLTT